MFLQDLLGKANGSAQCRQFISFYRHHFSLLSIFLSLSVAVEQAMPYCLSALSHMSWKVAVFICPASR